MLKDPGYIILYDETNKFFFKISVIKIPTEMIKLDNRTLNICWSEF